jgi:ketosteroid isomerase-like protein
MASERVEIVRRAHEALNAGDIDGLIAVCDPNFRLDMSDRVFNPAVYEGHDGIRAFHEEVMEIWQHFTWEPTELREKGDVVIAVLRSTGHARGSGVELDRRSAMLWRVESGRAISLTFYRDPEEARAAARSA